MKAVVFPYKNVQQYLDAIGVLETGTALEIHQARKVFRKLYLKQYQKQRYDRTHSNITLSFSKKEKTLLQQVAIRNGKRLSSFLKEVALSYASDSEIQPLVETIDISQIKQLLSLSFDIVEALHFENNYPELKQSYDKLLRLFEQLETLVK